MKKEKKPASLLTQEQFIALYEYLGLLYRNMFSRSKRQRAKSLQCDHTLRYTLAWLRKQKVSPIRANTKKIVDLGGHCDCEVLLNVDPETWEKRRDEELRYPKIVGEVEAETFVSELMLESTRQLPLW